MSSYLLLQAPTLVLLCLECTELFPALGFLHLLCPLPGMPPGTFKGCLQPSSGNSAPDASPREASCDPQARCYCLSHQQLYFVHLFICLPCPAPMAPRVNPEGSD